MNSGQAKRREREFIARQRSVVLPMTDARYRELLDAALERKAVQIRAWLEGHHG